jgi:cyclopropane-fatty-acyl-phospholipid synthase
MKETAMAMVLNEESMISSQTTWLDHLARRMVFARWEGLQRGRITVIDGSGRQSFGRTTGDAPLTATIHIHDPSVYSSLAFGGTVGASGDYMDGLWSCDDLTSLVRILVRNRAVLDGMEQGVARLRAPLRQLVHRRRRNTRTGSRRNIAAHYDLGNEFFSLMLDETMMYSCAFFKQETSTLREASTAKNDRICRKLNLSSADHVLEIGTGWGGFALHAASHYHCRVTTTTISQRQYEVAVRRVQEAGLTDRVTVLLKDYRDLHELGIKFDALVSIEMIEAVGHAYYDTYFKACSDLLKPHGRMLLQAITIEDRRYEQATRSVDFIQQYIFPGSCIPSVTALCSSATRATDMGLFHLEDIGAHYPPTLRGWRERLCANRSKVRALGYSDSFLRLWELYLCYCEGGFLERSISSAHLLFVKPLYRPQTILQPSPSLTEAACSMLL